MKQTRSASAQRQPGIGKWIDAAAEGLGRLLEAFGPQPQLKPIPVKVRSGRAPGAR